LTARTVLRGSGKRRKESDNHGVRFSLAPAVPASLMALVQAGIALRREGTTSIAVEASSIFAIIDT
jgi:hypothetical protein